METLLGVVAAIAFLVSGAPLVWAAFRAARLRGYSRLGWSALTIAVTAITIQLILLGAAPLILGAQLLNNTVVVYLTVATWRKG